MGADFVARSGLGDELNVVPLTSTRCSPRPNRNLFAPRRRLRHPRLQWPGLSHTSRLRSSADNFLELIAGRPMTGSFGAANANCFIESGDGKACSWHRLQTTTSEPMMASTAPAAGGTR